MNRRSLLSLAAPALGGALAACGAPGGSSAPAGKGTPETQYAVQVASSDLAVGKNRVAFVVLKFTKGMEAPVRIPDAQLNLRYYFPIDPQPIPKGDGSAQFWSVDSKDKGLYVTQGQFDQAGTWGLEVSGTANGAAFGPARAAFMVKPKPETPAIGAPAPRSKNLTRYDVDDIKKIDSGLKPNDMHELSIADAIEQKKPLLIVFGSPGFCPTQTCAPEVEEVQKLKAKVGDKANFIHVEIWKDPLKREPYPTVTEWGLPTDPWVFLVDRNGMVADKFEGPAPLPELEAALAKLF